MTDAPERIWVWTYKMGEGELGAWDVDPEEAPPNASRYILATPEALAASPEVKALVREAEARGMERAAERLDLAEHDAEERDWRSGANAFATLARVIRAELAAANAREAGLTGLIRWAHDTLWELNPSNYDHDEVCKVNDAAVEVILGLAPVIGETHGHSAEWWAERAALAQPSTATPTEYERKVAQMKEDFPNGI